MEYFYIACSIASLLSMFISLYILYSETTTRFLAKLLVILFPLITILFWLWFYIAPKNPVKMIISERSILVNTYTNGEKYTDIVEGVIEFLELGSKDVLLPPFKNKPDVSFIAIEGSSSNPPEILELTKDKIVIKIDNDVQLKKWIFRARGEILRKINETTQKTNE